MRSESSRRRTGDRNPVPVVVFGTAGIIVVGTGLLAVPAGGAVARSGVGRLWLYSLVVAAIVGAIGAGDPEPAARRLSRRLWAAGVALFALTLGVPLLLDAADANEAALPLLLAGAFSMLLAASLGALVALAVVERRRAARDRREREQKRARRLQPATQRRRGSSARSRAGGPPGSRRGRP